MEAVNIPHGHQMQSCLDYTERWRENSPRICILAGCPYRNVCIQEGKCLISIGYHGLQEYEIVSSANSWDFRLKIMGMTS